MRTILPLAVISVASVWAQGQQQPSPELVEKMKSEAKAAVMAGQKPAAAPSKPGSTYQVNIPAEAVVPIGTLPPSTVVATVDGRKVTAGDLQAVLKALPPQVQQQAQADRRKFVEQYGVLLRLSGDARKDKLDQQSPYREAIEYGTMQVLYQAEINKKFADMNIPQEELKKAYDSGKDKYVQAKVRAIYIPFSTAPVSQADANGKKLLSESEAKAKADDLVKQIRGGADFIKLVKEHSGDARSVEKDGDFGHIHKSDNIPVDLKNVIFSAKQGEVTEPVRQANGFYIFRIEEVGAQPFDEVQGTITNELKNAQFVAWLSGLQKSLDIKMEHEVPPGIQLTPMPSGSVAPPAK